MKEKKYLDNIIKSAINDSVFSMEASKNIFNEAWNTNENEMSKRKYFSIKKVALVPVCCAALVLGGVFIFSPGMRVVAQEALKTIFLLNKSGNIEEKTENTDIVLSFGHSPITNENKGEMERRLGFKVNLPEKIDDYRLGSHLYGPGLDIVASGIKYNDQEKIQNKLKSAIDDDKVFKELEKDYKMSREVYSIYVDNQGHEFQMYLSKDSGKNLKDYGYVIKEFNVNNIECVIIKRHSATYNVKENNYGVAMTDMEHKPISTEDRYDMFWKYDGVSYYLDIGKNASDIDAAIEFTKEYIKILEQK